MNVREIDPKSTDYRQVKIVIGGDGETYNPGNPHFEMSAVKNMGPQVFLLLPDTVAEHFRQQGRRQLQTEFRRMMNTSKA